VLSLPDTAWDSIVCHARESAPRECCGLLLGRPEAGEVLEVWPTRNDAAGHSLFLVNAEDHFAAIHAARARGLEVIGEYHSHPRSPATPSPTDLAESGGGPWLHVITSLASEQAELKAYRYTENGPIEVPIRRGDRAPG
jgi:proteasome lid subunit RPN8/RPN11